MNSSLTRAAALAALGALSFVALGQTQYAWRYYRPGNTGIQGDYCDALWIGADGDPWIGGYGPSFEEGGIAKFVQSENRWVNVSNVDFPVIGHPDLTGTTRVSEIVADSHGTLWMSTGRGALKFDPAVGPSSLVNYNVDNSALPGGWNTNVEIAPDGTIWFTAYSTVWGAGGTTRFNPATNAWTGWENIGGEEIAVQAKPGGGYYVWADGSGALDRFDSTTQSWTSIPREVGRPGGLPGKVCTDAGGNTWMYRLTSEFGHAELDCLRPDGTWIGITGPGNDPSAFRALGSLQAIMVDGGGTCWRYNGTSWSSLGNWRQGPYTDDVQIDAAGNVWVCGIGGAARRDAVTGIWQRHRLTNNGQMDSFANDLALDPGTGRVWACSNGAPGIGGMEMFDGTRWTGFNNETYGMGEPWPFPTDNSESIFVRPSNGKLVVNPMYGGTMVYDNGVWSALTGGSSTVKGYAEDSLGRLWQLGEYFSLGYWTGSAWNNVSIAAWGQKIQPDPDRAGTVWANAGYEVTRTDGVYRFSRTIDDFPELTSQSDTFSGLAVGRNGVAWLGCTVMFGAGGSGGGLVRLDANTGAYSMIKYEDGNWPFPGQYVMPLAVTPDGRVWMQYDSDFLVAERGLCWYDGTNVGVFPAPPGGEPQWGGLPHAGIKDLEVKIVPGGYELWMSCLSRGIAVLRVTGSECAADFNGDGQADFFDYLDFAQAFDAEDPSADFNGDNQVDFFDYLDFIQALDAGC
jgi:hypothetical protein